MPVPSPPALPESRDLWGRVDCQLLPQPRGAIPVRAALASAAPPGSGQGGAASHPQQQGGACSLCYLCFFQPVTRADGLACCVQCCFKRAERNKIIRFSVSADFSDMFIRCCRCGGMQGPPGMGSSEQSLPVLMHRGQPGSARRCGEISCVGDSPQSEDPVSPYWFPELLCNPYVSLSKIERYFSELYVAGDSISFKK